MSTVSHEEPCLTDDMNGVHIVETSDGTQLRVDLDDRVVTTYPVVGSSIRRRRSQEVALVLLATCRVGEPMVLLLDLDIPGVWFTRRTTEAVARIRSADDCTASGRSR